MTFSKENPRLAVVLHSTALFLVTLAITAFVTMFTAIALFMSGWSYQTVKLTVFGIIFICTWKMFDLMNYNIRYYQVNANTFIASNQAIILASLMLGVGYVYTQTYGWIVAFKLEPGANYFLMSIVSSIFVFFIIRLFTYFLNKNDAQSHFKKLADTLNIFSKAQVAVILSCAGAALLLSAVITDYDVIMRERNNPVMGLSMIALVIVIIAIGAWCFVSDARARITEMYSKETLTACEEQK